MLNPDEKLKKAGMYFEMLYPDYAEMEPGEKFQIMRDYNVMLEHIDEIDEYYNTSMEEGSYAQHEGWSKQEIIESALKTVKANMYYEMIYPNHAEMDPGEEFQTMRDLNFILNNIDEIDRMCVERIVGAERSGQMVSKGSIVKEIVEELKHRITTEQIGQATINVPTSEKKETEHVENTRNNNKGEIAKDDN